MTSNNGKDVIYVDVDDEITGIIDKVATAPNKIVALVLPKRAAVLQSVVNMKLLKKRADVAKKHLVLITSEPSLMPLAGVVGVHVAKTLQSKPEVPAGLVADEAAEDAEEAEAATDDFDLTRSADKPVGELAGDAASQMPEETIELDNSTSSPDGTAGKDVAALAATGAVGKVGGKRSAKNKKLSVPNFERFRLLLMLGGLALIVLLIGYFVASRAFAKATVIIKTQTTNINSSLTPTLDAQTASLDTSSQTVPAKVEKVQKTYTAEVNATGKQNNGDKATGTVTMTAQECNGASFPTDVPAGSGLSANGLTFITQQDTAFSASGINFSNGCFNYTATGPTTITAQNGGTQYNVNDGTTFTVAGRSDIGATGSTTGGTDNIVTVVQQADIDSAKQKAEQGVDKNAIKQQLQQQLQSDGEYVLPATFSDGKPSVNASSKVGDQSSSVTVTETITYTMFGARRTDLQQLIAANVNPQIDTSKQAIQDYGLGSADVTVPNPGTGNKVQLDMQLTSVVGPHLDHMQLKAAIEGKKSGQAESVIDNDPGVESVKVHLSPFWIGTVPKNPHKIQLVFEKASPNGNH